MGLDEDEREADSIVYKTKVVQFLDRSVPIILQNDNGPCPLLAISNVLSLRNNVTLNMDATEISQQELLSRVAEWLLDANSSIQNKDEEYIKNQQQNIEDAIHLLPRLATGIDVNVRFRHIHDFEFTPECAIFDLFHVGLVHGWLCDPQDEVSVNVIGSNSYNTLVEKLVTFQACKTEQAPAQIPSNEEPTVYSTAAMTLDPGAPSPQTLSNEGLEGLSDEDRPRRKGDDEEAAELLQALQLSQSDGTFLDVSSDGVLVNDTTEILSQNESGILTDAEISVFSLSPSLEVCKLESDPARLSVEERIISGGIEFAEGVASDSHVPMLRHWLTEDAVLPEDEGNVRLTNDECSSLHKKLPDSANNEDNSSVLTVGEVAAFDVNRLELETPDLIESFIAPNEHSNEDTEAQVPKDALRIFTGAYPDEVECSSSSCLDDDEPLYEGESCLSETGLNRSEQKQKAEVKKPLQEGEPVLAEQAQASCSEDASFINQLYDSQRMGDEALSLAMSEGMIIENFLSSNASQLTYYGLFSLQEGLKDNELYVFFRNNHFSTMFKFNGQLYLLATDQGYLGQPDLVWEKLTEVGGDSIFTTGSFHVFEADQSAGLWNEHEAVAATADYIASQQINVGVHEGGNYNSDLQLAMALQQQELEQQQQQQQQQVPQQQQLQQQTQARVPSSAPRRVQPSGKSSSIGAGPLVTGPVRSSFPQPKQEKPKDKCTIM